MKYQLLILCFLFTLSSNAQDWDIPRIAKSNWNTETPQSVDKRKRNILLISEATAYSISLVGLNQLWYADYPKSKFHFINDNGEWLQMDKLGHLTVSYYSGVAGIKAYQWTGMSRKNAIWYGGLTGTFFLTIVEVLDGQSAEWGASSGDLIANSLGSFLAIGQELIWNEQRIQLKYSYKPSIWANQNPEQLGGNHLERALKDYNGQTYWLSFNLKSLFNIQNEDFPNWLSLSLGHSANKMITPYQEAKKENGKWCPKRKRQYLLSFDIDLNKIKTKNKIFNSLLHTFGFLKFPAPTLELRSGGLYFHSIYF
jgi:hypothetical protein